MRRLRNSFLGRRLIGGADFRANRRGTGKPGREPRGGQIAVSLRVQDEHGLPHGTVSLPNLLGNKKKILKLQAAGMSDQAILAQFAQEQGKEVVASPPGVLGSLSFYTAAVLGLILVLLVIRRYSRRGALAAAGARWMTRCSTGITSKSRKKWKSWIDGSDCSVLVTAGTVIFTLFVRGRDIPETPPASPTAHLEQRKAQIYENLRDLQFEFRVGKLSDADYQKTKLDLQRELAKVLAEIDCAGSRRRR